jgi:hypothetical protein
MEAKMNKVSILVVLVLMLALSALPATAITGGELDGDWHPNVGMMIAEIDGVPVWRCSGTLIAPRVFLTAGHCAGDGATWARVWFENDMANVPDYPWGGEVAHEGKPMAHPYYSWPPENIWPNNPLYPNGDFYDVGVVILDEPVDNITPATLATPGLLSQLKEERILMGGWADGYEVYFRSVGYGVTLTSWPHPTQDNNKVRMVSESAYVALTRNILHLTQRAVFEEDGTCGGDSGGPAFWIDPDGNEILVAVTSRGDGPCIASGLDYRVDNPQILEWIYSMFPAE